MKPISHAALAALVTTCLLALSAGPAAAAGCKTEYSAPTASFTYSPFTPDAGSEVTFDASGSQPGAYTSYSYNAQSQSCEIADSGAVAISSYRWQWGDGTPDTTGSATAKHTFASPGAYTVTLTVGAGSAGSDSASSTVRTTWKVTLTDPVEPPYFQQKFKRGMLTLGATAAGPTAVQRVEFYVRGVKVGEDSTAPYSLSFDTASVADGDAAIYARAIGTGTSAGSSTARTVVFDNTAPAYTILDGPTGPVKPGGDSFLVRFTDAGYLYGNPLCWADSPTPVNSDYCIGGGVAQTFEGRYTYWLPEGDHTVHFRAADAAGNETTFAVDVTIDGTAPDTTIGGGPDAGFTLASSEANSTFRCRVYPDGRAAPAFGACSSSAGQSVAGLAPGTYRFEALASDAAGNEDATPATRSFVVSAPPPAGGGQGSQPAQSTQSSQSSAWASTTTTTTTQGGPAKPAAGKCAKLKGKGRAACIRRSCAKVKKKGAKRYRACVKGVTRRR